MIRFAVPLLLILASAVPSLAGDQLMTLRHIAEMRMVSSAKVSPDGQHVAYTLAVPRNPFEEENGPAWTELHVVDRGGHSRAFVAGQVSVSGVQWTPDGQGIAFTARRNSDEHTSLYVIPIDGGEAKRVLQHAADVRGVSFHPDGNRIAFLATEPPVKEQQESQAKGFDQQIYEEDWRPTRVWIGTLDGGEEPHALELDGSARFVQWSPSGKELAVVWAPTPLVDDTYMFKRIAIVDADTGIVVQRVRNPGKLGQVAWSPNGKHLAMVSGEDIHDPREGRLMVTPIPGDTVSGDGGLRDLLPGYEAHIGSFAWLDDETLIWVAGEGVSTTVGRVDLAENRAVIYGPGQPILAGVSLSHDGTVAALVGHTPTHPYEVYLLETDTGSARRLTDSNPVVNDLRFAKQEVVTWKARDGMQLQGILVYPLNYEQGRRYPLLMVVHGGPESHVRNGWVTSYSRPGQVGAARGFAMFFPNYRGSTGRGVEFSKLGQADAAGAEFDDLVDGVDHLISIGLADRDRVGITGGSYGGYASAWGATYYSDRFAASVMFVGISDVISKVGTTDIPEEMYLVHHRKRLWEDWDYFINRSPIRYVQRHKTPILILHGKEDPRVDPSQSKELHRHLKTLGQAPVRLVLYPGEGHGNRRAAARFDYSVRLMRWMEYYLQEDGGSPPDYEIDHAQEFGQ